MCVVCIHGIDGKILEPFDALAAILILIMTIKAKWNNNGIKVIGTSSYSIGKFAKISLSGTVVRDKENLENYSI